MKFGFKKMITTVSALALCAGTAMAEGSAVDAVATAATGVAGNVATAAGTVVVAAFAIFGVIWGARKIKSALSGGA